MASKLPATEAAIFTMARAGEDSKSFWVSRANAENVVNAPRNPVMTSGWNHDDCSPLRDAIQPKIKPMRKQPVRLHASIPSGKRCNRVFSTNDWILDETPYRDNAPSPPPRKMSIRFIGIKRVGSRSWVMRGPYRSLWRLVRVLRQRQYLERRDELDWWRCWHFLV